MSPTPPVERPEGQDDETPDLLLSIVVTIRLLRDVRDLLRAQYEREHPKVIVRHIDLIPEDAGETADLLLRVVALLSVLRRLRKRLEDEQP
jgi:hypothetical protein